MGAAFRLLSANLRHGRAEPVALAALVEELGPDVVAVQELGPAQAAVLRRLLPFGLLEPARGYTGMGLLLRRPGVVRRVPLPHRDAYVAEIVPPGVPEGGPLVEVINVHVAAPHSQPPWRALARRRRQLHRLLAYLDAAPHRPRALVGDLNATPAWPLYRRLTARLQDAALAAARRQGRLPRRTWGPWPGSPRLLRIDHVLTRDLVVLDLAVRPLPGSDHSAVVADLGLPDPDA